MIRRGLTIVVTGAGSALGQALLRALAARPVLAGGDGAALEAGRLIGVDRTQPAELFVDERVEYVRGEYEQPRFLSRMMGASADSVFHLAPWTAGDGVAPGVDGLELALLRSVDTTRALLDACRNLSHPPRLVYAARRGVRATVGEVPQGTALLVDVCESLLAESARRGLIDLRSVRLPADAGVDSAAALLAAHELAPAPEGMWVLDADDVRLRPPVDGAAGTDPAPTGHGPGTDPARTRQIIVDPQVQAQPDPQLDPQLSPEPNPELSPQLDPQARALLDLIAARGVPPVYTLSPPQAREAYALRGRLTKPDPPPVAQLGEHRIEAAGGLRVREYRPHTSDAPDALPALVYLHGGGWTIGDLDTHDVVCRALCNGASCVVLSVDYRLAPEARFPAAYDDSVAAFRWAAAQAAHLGIDPQRIAIGGDSAGGNLAAAASLGLAKDAVRPVFQLLVYPATDQRVSAPSHASNGQGYLLTREAILWYRGNYLPDERDWLDWRASPLLAPSHAGQPPGLVLTAGFDPLRDEGRQYAQTLSSAGVAAQYVCFERQIHGFLTMGRLLREADTALDLCAAALRRAFAA